LAAPRRYYPGFFGAAFLVLLRIAIGWHFLYEGTQKILSTPEGKVSILARVFPVPEGPPFSSEGYLRASTGPLAPKFRSLVPDVDSREKLKLESVKAAMAAELARVDAHFGFDAKQKDDAKKVHDKAVGDAEDWYKSVENAEKIKKYLAELDEIEAVEANPSAMSYERANAWADRKTAEADRKALVKTVDSWVDSLRDGLVAVAKSDPKRFEGAGPYVPGAGLTLLQVIDLLTIYGLTAVGLCLMLGLFTPLAALGGAAFLAGFYLSMPPWPGLPEGIVEGHYRYVNKNLVELLACLVLASTPNGLWIGLDALLFGWIGRGHRHEIEPEPEFAAPPAKRPEPQDRRKFKKR
jgi:uncharacterized membrane protein YphA (DoxX/SURF4 family)